MTANVRARRPAAVVVLSLLAVPFVGSSAGATGIEVCNPTPHQASSFCVTYSAAIGPTLNAGDPFGVDATFANTSDAHASDEHAFIDSVALHLSASNVSAPSITPSVDLPNDLVIAGDDGNGCAGPDFAGCTAGHGVFVAHVTGTPLGQFDGFYTGHFGVLRVLNVNDQATQPGTFRYRIDVQACVDLPPPFGSCFVSLSDSYPVEGPVPAGSGSGAFDFTIPHVIDSGTIQNSGGVHYVGSLDSGVVHLQGTSTKLDDGTAVGPFDLFRLPKRCGTVSGSATFGSNETTPRTVDIPQADATVVGCPTAAFTSTLHGSRADLDGSASAAQVGGRTVSSWRWKFGDGTTATTATGTTSHSYPASPAKARDYTASLVVVDSEGALSSPATAVIHGTAVSLAAPVKNPTRLRVSGTVSPSSAGQPVTVVLQHRNGTTFQTLATKHLTLDPASSFSGVFARPATGMCRAIARFAGDSTHLASRDTSTFSC